MGTDGSEPVHPPQPLSRDADGVDVVRVVRYLVILTVMILVVSAGLWGMVRLLGGRARAGDPVPGPLAVREEGRRPQGPRLQEHPFRDIEDLRRDEQIALADYARDPQTGAIRIPVERAMDLVAERGLPDWGTPLPEVTPRPTPRPKGTR